MPDKSNPIAIQLTNVSKKYEIHHENLPAGRTYACGKISPLTQKRSFIIISLKFKNVYFTETIFSTRKTPGA